MSITASNIASHIVDSGAKKAGEGLGSRAINALVDFAKKKYKEEKVNIGSAFDRYLKNAWIRYNQVRTLATGSAPRMIIGENSIYEEINLKCNKIEISTHTAAHILSVSNNILIEGTGGIGKSMLMRYLFLNTALEGDYIPVLLELRRISKNQEQSISILKLIYDCLSDFDVDLDKNQFEYSLRSGKYLFLFDGFDEVKDELSKESAEAIQKFCSKYPDNPCIVTSRPLENASPMETFTILESMPLTKKQAVSLSSKIWKEDEKTRQFCEQLDNELFDAHRDFAENPLLLSMMFLTFMRNSSIPDHLSDFYRKAYDALYSAHDSNDKGYFQRDFQCCALDEGEFQLLFSHFCFKSYFNEDYEFSEEQLLKYITNSNRKLIELNKFSNKTINPKDYLADLRNAVCMIIKDGNVYRFSHRSFQAYFAALYTTVHLTDEQQKRLFRDQLSSISAYWRKGDYYNLAFQIEGNRFSINALEDKLREIKTKAESSDNPDKYLMNCMVNAVALEGIDEISYSVSHDEDGSCYAFNVLELFRVHHTTIIKNRAVIKKIRAILNKYFSLSDDEFSDHVFKEVSISKINKSDLLNIKEKEELYNLMIKDLQIDKERTSIDKWLLELEEQRKVLYEPNYFDEL